MNKSFSTNGLSIIRRIMVVMLIAGFAWVDASAQGSVTVGQLSRASRQRQQNRENPYSSVYTYQTQRQQVRSHGNFFAEYNRMTMDVKNSYTKDPSFNGVSVGFDYFLPFAGELGVDIGLKAQYFFRNEKEGIYTYKDNLLAGTLPVRLAYDWRAGESFALMPFAGVFGRINFSGKKIYEESGKSGRTSINLFDDDQTSFYNLEKLKRFQFGWEAGVRARFSDTFTIGASYWMDFSEIGTNTKLKGFNIQLGACF